MKDAVMNQYDVAIVGGFGHIGLPLGLVFAQADNNVLLYDTNTKIYPTIAAGKMPFHENGAQEILERVLGKQLFLSVDPADLAKAHFIVIVIGTPVDEHLNPQFTLFKQLFDQLLPYLHEGQHIILRSTVFPGSTQKIQDYLISKGKKISVSFCPERIAQGHAIQELHQLPQIISSCDQAALPEVKKLFAQLTDSIIELSCLEAELAKLFTNSWRYIQFATANQFYQIAQQNNVDFYTIYNAMTQNYPRTQGFPKAGFAAGPCLFKDTMQLAAYANNNFFLGHAAMLINEGMPNFIVEELKKRNKLHTKTVGILGMAFKADNDDHRESLAYKLKKILELEAGKVICSDEYIKDSRFVTKEQLLAQADIVIIGAPHKVYQDLILSEGKELINVWSAQKYTQLCYPEMYSEVSPSIRLFT